jgi:RHS repeat-associated protein
LGSIRDIIDAKGKVIGHREYNAFGKVTRNTGKAECIFGYTGKIFDNQTHLQWNINRWYDANVGRWISEDPIGFLGNDFCLYRYASNETTILYDILGLATWNTCCPCLFECLKTGIQAIANSYSQVINALKEYEKLYAYFDLAFRAYDNANQQNSNMSLWWLLVNGSAVISATSVAALGTYKLSGLVTNSRIVQSGVKGFQALTAGQRTALAALPEVTLYAAIASWLIQVTFDVIKVHQIAQISGQLLDMRTQIKNEVIADLESYATELDDAFAAYETVYSTYDGKEWTMSDKNVCKSLMQTCSQNNVIVLQGCSTISTYVNNVVSLSGPLETALIGLVNP